MSVTHAIFPPIRLSAAFLDEIVKRSQLRPIEVDFHIDRNPTVVPASRVIEMEVCDTNFDNTGKHFFLIPAFGQTIRGAKVQRAVPVATAQGGGRDGSETRGR